MVVHWDLVLASHLFVQNNSLATDLILHRKAANNQNKPSLFLGSFESVYMYFIMHVPNSPCLWTSKIHKQVFQPISNEYLVELLYTTFLKNVWLVFLQKETHMAAYSALAFFSLFMFVPEGLFLERENTRQCVWELMGRLHLSQWARFWFPLTLSSVPCCSCCFSCHLLSSCRSHCLQWGHEYHSLGKLMSAFLYFASTVLLSSP